MAVMTSLLITERAGLSVDRTRVAADQHVTGPFGAP